MTTLFQFVTILDASKGWGVAQRRRRVFAVLDLAGECAGQVLFESEGLSGYSPPGIEARQGTAGCAEESAGIPGTAVEYNPTDSRIKIKDDGICQTLTARMGTGGNTVPLTLKIRSGCEGGGKGPLIQTDLSATLSTNNDQTLFDPKVYGICSNQSNAMLSDNPHSGFYEAETSRTLDCNGGNPVCNQGGMAVCAMNVGFFAATEEKALALMGRDWKDPPVVAPVSEYLVRRLTPDECCRLQGYPDGWCRGLASKEPSDEEVDRWLDIFALWDGIQGKSRPRTRKQIIKWLKDPNTDSAEYKVYGNSIAVPCVFFVLAGIVWAAGKEGSE